MRINLNFQSETQRKPVMLYKFFLYIKNYLSRVMMMIPNAFFLRFKSVLIKMVRFDSIVYDDNFKKNKIII